jgi:photosystem II biogenesis protein Psp29
MTRSADSRQAHSAFRRRRSPSQLGLLSLALVAAWQGWNTVLSAFASAPLVSTPPRQPSIALHASPLDSIHNPVKTVAQSISDFYQAYPQPPILPMYRTFIIDFLTQMHVAVVDGRFKYDAIFGLGMWHYYKGIMGSYDKMLGNPESEKIWVALMKALDLDPEKVKADAEAMISYAGGASPGDILQNMEGSSSPSDAKVGEAFENIKKSLYTMSFSIGLFRIMELSGVEVKKENVEEWAKALNILPTSKVTSDLETYKQNQVRLQKAEEMLREIEIREKKKLAERLEQKAKALAEKAAAKKASLVEA